MNGREIVVEPALALWNGAIPTDAVDATEKHGSLLLSESVRREPPTPFLKLLPCRDRAGVAEACVADHPVRRAVRLHVHPAGDDAPPRSARGEWRVGPDADLLTVALDLRCRRRRGNGRRRVFEDASVAHAGAVIFRRKHRRRHLGRLRRRAAQPRARGDAPLRRRRRGLRRRNFLTIRPSPIWIGGEGCREGARAAQDPIGGDGHVQKRERRELREEIFRRRRSRRAAGFRAWGSAPAAGVAPRACPVAFLDGFREPTEASPSRSGGTCPRATALRRTDARVSRVPGSALVRARTSCTRSR